MDHTICLFQWTRFPADYLAHPTLLNFSSAKSAPVRCTFDPAMLRCTLPPPPLLLLLLLPPLLPLLFFLLLLLLLLVLLLLLRLLLLLLLRLLLRLLRLLLLLLLLVMYPCRRAFRRWRRLDRGHRRRDLELQVSDAATTRVKGLTLTP